jgi:hypothetical protein
MKTGDLIDVRVRVAFEKNEATNWKGEPMPGVVTRGFEVMEGDTKWEGLIFLDLPEDIGMGMPKGTVHHMTIRRKALKKDKDASLPASWNYEMEKQGDVIPQETPAPQKGQGPKPTGYVSDYDRQASIQRQVALKGAVDLAANGMLVPPDEEPVYEMVLRVASRFSQWLECIEPEDASPASG